MRILVISNLLPPRVLGGYEIACWNLSKGLRARGHDVLVLTTPATEVAPEPQDFVQRTLAMRAYVEPQSSEPHVKAVVDHECMVAQNDNTLQVLDAIADFRPDHVLCFNLVGIGAMAILDAVRATGIPFTVNLGDRLPNAMTEGVSQQIREQFGFGDGSTFRSGGYAAVSRRLLDEIARDGVDLGGTVTVISRGVDAAALLPRTRAYRQGGHTRFVAAGSIGEHKGVDLMVRAAALLVAQGLHDFSIDIYGDGERERFTALAAELGVTDRVSLPGTIAQHELFAVLAGSDSFLFPTWQREPFGNAPVEAAAHGCVPILTAGSGAAERLVDGVHGLTIERTADALASAMARVINGEVDLQAMGDAGRELARGDLSLERSVVELEQFLARPVSTVAVDPLPVIRRDVTARAEHARELLHGELDQRDAASSDATGAVLARVGRRLAARLRPAPTAPTEPEPDRVGELESENSALRAEVEALRRYLKR